MLYLWIHFANLEFIMSYNFIGHGIIQNPTFDVGKTVWPQICKQITTIFLLCFLFGYWYNRKTINIIGYGGWELPVIYKVHLMHVCTIIGTNAIAVWRWLLILILQCNTSLCAMCQHLNQQMFDCSQDVCQSQVLFWCVANLDAYKIEGPCYWEIALLGRTDNPLHGQSVEAFCQDF